MSQVVHLHVHTQFSILDGASDIKKLVRRAKELGMPALAITDHGNMFGVKLFHQTATKEGVKPILGCEVYVVSGSRHEKVNNKEARYHLILLAKNLTGYHNLMRIVSYSWTEGFYSRPRCDKELLRKYSEGLICCSACLGGELSKAIVNGGEDRASAVIEEFKSIYGSDYYLEMQLHRPTDASIGGDTYESQLEVNEAIVRLARKHGVKCMVSNDVHFINEEDAPAHDRLICLNTGADLHDPARMRYTGQEFLKSYDQMLELFPEYPEALETTLEIADKIETYSLSRDPYMPDFPLPDDFPFGFEKLRNGVVAGLEKITNLSAGPLPELKNRLESVSSLEELESAVAGDPALESVAAMLTTAKQFEFLEHITCEGARKRYGDTFDDRTRARLEFELSTIERMGFPGYFLIVWDFIRAGRQMGVSVGPGRGSAAGSVVAYCLGITNIDPLKYDLLFERFLNPERISMPDVDIDFDEDGRADVLKYVVDKYGQKRVAQIITFGTMAAKLAIRDVARVQKLPLPESDRLAKMVPERPGISLDEAFKEVPELDAERRSENKLITETLQYAHVLEGSVRQTGVHACGVIIGRDDLEKFVPLATSKDAELFVVQYDGKHVEDIGLLKMDFLGLKTLSIIKDAVHNVYLSKGIRIDIDAIPLDDPKTYELYSSGETTGLFQFESPGMKKHLRALKPNRFEDLIAMNALYRPGPMEYIPDFIARKHGQQAITYDLPEMEEYLKDTYGITVYQEQVMLLSQKLAGFTGGQADTLRKAMGKKQKEVLDKMKDKFLDGAAQRGHDKAICEKIWRDWEAFASYAFNKSHSTCYAYVSYQTAYLKANYPAEFMAALLSRNLSDISKIGFFMDECRRMGINVLGPDVNKSLSQFSVDADGNIRYGMGGVKGVGELAVQNIIDTRKESEYTSVYDFFERVNLQTVNKKCVESLAAGGAFDSVSDFHRSLYFIDPEGSGNNFIGALAGYGQRIQSEKNNAQQSLFGGFGADVTIQKPQPPAGEQWSKLMTLNKEKEVTGIYLSAHPLDEYDIVIKNFCSHTLSDFNNLEAIKGSDFAVAGLVTEAVHLFSKEGKPYGRFTIEDYTDKYQFSVFGKQYEEFRRYMYEHYYLFVKGSVRPRPYRETDLEARIGSISTLSEAKETLIRELTIAVDINDIDQEFVSGLKTVAAENKGSTRMRIKLIDYEMDMAVTLYSRTFPVDVNRNVVKFMENYQLRYALR